MQVELDLGADDEGLSTAEQKYDPKPIINELRGYRHYAAPDLLLIDELGYLSYSNRHADLLFELISRRYEHKSTVITTNRGIKKWQEVLPNAACTVSLSDRLVHRCGAQRAGPQRRRTRGGAHRRVTRTGRRSLRDPRRTARARLGALRPTNPARPARAAMRHSEPARKQH